MIQDNYGFTRDTTIEALYGAPDPLYYVETPPPVTDDTWSFLIRLTPATNTWCACPNVILLDEQRRIINFKDSTVYGVDAANGSLNEWALLCNLDPAGVFPETLQGVDRVSLGLEYLTADKYSDRFVFVSNRSVCTEYSNTANTSRHGCYSPIMLSSAPPVTIGSAVCPRTRLQYTIAKGSLGGRVWYDVGCIAYNTRGPIVLEYTFRCPEAKYLAVTHINYYYVSKPQIYLSVSDLYCTGPKTLYRDIGYDDVTGLEYVISDKVVTHIPYKEVYASVLTDPRYFTIFEIRDGHLIDQDVQSLVEFFKDVTYGP